MLISGEQARALLRDKLFVFGAAIIALVILVSLAGSSIRPDSSPYANSQYLELAALPPMTRITFLLAERNEVSEETSGFASYFIGRRQSTYRIPVESWEANGDWVVFTKYGGEISDSLHLADVFYALAEEKAEIRSGEVQLASGSSAPYVAADLQKRLKAERISEQLFVFGADKYGRDLLSRLMSGAYVSFSVGSISVLISLVLGITLGLLAGYYRGWTDRIILWFVNVIWSVPTLLMVLSISLVLGKGFWQIFIAVGLTMWVEVARVVRGQVLSLREKEFVEAARILGFSNTRILLRHILPNVLSPVIVISAANFASAILLEAGLSFLGLGLAPPQATWGRMISEHKSYIITGDAHLAIIPGLAIMVLVLSFTFIGNALRDVLDEKNVPVS